MKIRTADIERICSMAFARWCAEEMVDPRLFEILEEAFIAGFCARDSVEYVGSEMHGVAKEVAVT